MKIISLGCNCSVKELIKQNYIDNMSYPFDWLWCNIDFVIKTFERDYFEFTECEKLNPILDNQYPNIYIFNNNCNGSENRVCSAVSLHDTDTRSFDKYISNISIINDKYKRRFNRLYETLNTEDNVILIRKILPNNQGAVKHDIETIDKLNYLIELLNNKFHSNIILYIIDSDNIIDKNNYINFNMKIFNSFDEVKINIDKYYI
jgi:hypothetical protein